MRDAKVMQLGGSHFKTWVLCLCTAKENDGKIPVLNDLAFALRLRKDVCAQHLKVLVDAGLIDMQGDEYRPHNWNSRQFVSDDVTSRVKAFRERQRNVSGNVSSNVPGNAHETETKPLARAQSQSTESETEKAAMRPPRALRAREEPDAAAASLAAVVSEFTAGDLPPDNAILAEIIGAAPPGTDPMQIAIAISSMAKRRHFRATSYGFWPQFVRDSLGKSKPATPPPRTAGCKNCHGDGFVYLSPPPDATLADIDSGKYKQPCPCKSQPGATP
jgi:hypothetical protein